MYLRPSHVTSYLTVLLFILGLMLAPQSSRAANYALLIGVDDYQLAQEIPALKGAEADARSLAATLQEAAGFPAANITNLSGAVQRPTRAAILAALDGLRQKVQPGDVVFTYFSGHGVEIDGVSYLLPYDTQTADKAKLIASVVATEEVRQRLAQLPARALIMTYDMCRNDPFSGGARAIGGYNKLGEEQARDLVIRPRAQGAAVAGPQQAVTMFACSTGQRSWEWDEKKRGFFSWFLEQGLRREAADATGTVRVRNLTAYLDQAVYGKVREVLNREQVPYPVIAGAGVGDLVLATGRPPGQGGATAVPQQIGTGVAERFIALMQRGWEASRRREHLQAQSLFSQALELQPASGRAAYAVGFAAINLNNFTIAEKHLRMARALTPQDPETANALGTLYKRQGDLEAAEKSFREAMLLDPAESAYVSNLANIYWERKDYAKAEELNLQAARLDPKSGVPIFGLALIYDKIKRDYPRAEQLYRRVVQLDADDFAAWLNLGSLLAQRKNDLAGAEAAWLKAAALNDKDPSAAGNLAILYGMKEDYPAAAAMWKRAILINRADANSWAGYTEALFRSGRQDEARRMGRKTLALGYKGWNAAILQALGIDPASITEADKPKPFDPFDTGENTLPPLGTRSQEDETTTVLPVSPPPVNPAPANPAPAVPAPAVPAPAGPATVTPPTGGVPSGSARLDYTKLADGGALTGHRRPVRAVTFSRDGSMLASGSFDNTIHLWNARQLAAAPVVLQGHEDGIYEVAFSPDGRELLSASSDNTARIWTLATRQARLTLKHPDMVHGADYAPDGRQVVTACEDGSLRIWDSATGNLVNTLPSGRQSVYRVAWSPDPARLASGHFNNALLIWDAKAGKVLHTLTTDGAVVAVAFSPTGDKVAAGTSEGTLYLYESASGRLLHTLKGHEGGLIDAAFSPGGQVVGSSGVDGPARLWDVATGKLIARLPTKADRIHSISFSPDGKTLALGTGGSQVELWQHPG